MRVTFLSPYPNMGGGTRVIAIYADRLRRRGHEVTVVATPPKPIITWERIKRGLVNLEWRRLPKAILKPPQRSNAYFDYVGVPVKVIELFRPIDDHDVPDADVVIATWWETAEWVAKLSPQKGVKAYFLQHYEVFDYTPAERVKATWRMPLYKITVSKWLAELAAREYNDRTVQVVHNSVNTDQFYAATRDRQSPPTVGILYSTIYWKGIDVGLRAFEMAAKRMSGLRLIAFGAEPINSRFPLPSNSLFYHLPPQALIRDLYAACDVWMCASHSEGFGLPLLEAMACRCPVVSTTVGAASDLITNGINGYLVSTGDALMLANRIVDVLNHPNWRAMSDAAYAVANRYTWDDATSNLESALGKIVSEGLRVRSTIDRGELLEIGQPCQKGA